MDIDKDDHGNKCDHDCYRKDTYEYDHSGHKHKVTHVYKKSIVVIKRLPATGAGLLGLAGIMAMAGLITIASVAVGKASKKDLVK